MVINKKAVSLISVLAISSMLSACAILPEEEVFETTKLVTEYEKPEFSMTNVKRGDVCEFNKVVCKYSESNMQNVELDEWISVKQINFKKGDRVKKGDVLMTILSADVDKRIAEFEHDVKLLETKIRQARRMCELEVKKQRLVLDDDIAIKAIRGRYEATIGEYNSELEVANTGLNQAKGEQRDFQIVAEMDGTVTYLNERVYIESDIMPWERGQAFGESDSRDKLVMTISDGSLPRFTGVIDMENQPVQLTEGQSIQVVCNDAEYTTRVHFADETTVNFLLDYIPEELDSQMTGYAKDVIDERKNVLYLPKSAVSKMGDKDIVYCENKEGFKSAVEVQIGLAAEGKIEIISGLNEGDAVIVR